MSAYVNAQQGAIAKKDSKRKDKLLYHDYQTLKLKLAASDKNDSLLTILHQIRYLNEEKRIGEPIETYLDLAIAFHFKSNYDSLVYWEAKAAKQINSSSPYYAKYLLLSSYKSSFDGSYTEAIKKVLEALKIFEAKDEMSNMGLAFNSLAHDYERIGDYQKQREYLFKAIEVNKKTDNTYNLLLSYNNIGTSFKKEGKLNDALKYYNLAYEGLKKWDAPMLLAQNLNNRANIVEKLGDYKLAEDLFIQCMDICEANQIAYGVIMSELNLGNLYRLKKDYALSLSYLNSSLAKAQGMKLRREVALCYERLSWLNRDKGDFKDAYTYQGKYYALNDSLVNESVKREANELKVKYETERKEGEILALSKEKLVQRFIIASLIFLLIMGWQWMRNRNKVASEKKDKEQQRLRFELELKEKELLAHSLKKVSVMHTKAAVYDRIKSLLEEMPKSQAQKFRSILNELKSERDDQVIEEFEKRFVGVYEGFFTKLKAIAPDLTQAELKVAALLRLNFNSKEVASLTNRTVGTVENLRSSLRKKLQLDEKANLVNRLQEL